MDRERQLLAVAEMKVQLRDASGCIFTPESKAPCLVCNEECGFTRGSFTVDGETCALRIMWSRR